MSAVPYTVERRPDTGVNNVQLGVWLFLASEVMLFGGLLSAYFMLRAGAPEGWAPLRDHIGAAGRNTMLLIAASGSLFAARKRARGAAASRPRFVLTLAAALLFSIAFCAAKVSEYIGLVEHGLGPSVSTQMATYFLLTGVHFAHVVGGAVAVVWLMVTSGRAWSSPGVVLNRLAATALYWYFVDAVWLVLVVILYVV